MAKKLKFVHIEGHMTRSYQATNLDDVCPELAGTIFPTTPQADDTDLRDPRPTSVQLFYTDAGTVGSGSWGWCAYIADENGYQMTETVYGCYKADVVEDITEQARKAHLLRSIDSCRRSARPTSLRHHQVRGFSVTMDAEDYPIEQEELAAYRALRA